MLFGFVEPPHSFVCAPVPARRRQSVQRDYRLFRCARIARCTYLRGIQRFSGIFSMAALVWPIVVFAADVGDVRGLVHDAGHRPVAAATIELRSAHSELSQRAVSDRDGEFSFPSVPLGDYVLIVSASGYAT